jgi:hypothetical protein
LVTLIQQSLLSWLHHKLQHVFLWLLARTPPKHYHIATSTKWSSWVLSLLQGGGHTPHVSLARNKIVCTFSSFELLSCCRAHYKA